jgi:signal transduction histidine kinase
VTVNRYLQFARVGTPGGAARGDAAGTLAATLDLVEGEFRARGLALERSGDWSEAPVALDDASLKQLWLNLVQNALEAVPSGGHVRVACAREAGLLSVVLKDDGPGIPAGVLARLGEPFFTTRAQGTGLGLHLSRQLVQAAGGSVRVESQEGAGTTVTVELPLA